MLVEFTQIDGPVMVPAKLVCNNGKTTCRHLSVETDSRGDAHYVCYGVGIGDGAIIGWRPNTPEWCPFLK